MEAMKLDQSRLDQLLEELSKDEMLKVVKYTVNGLGIRLPLENHYMKIVDAYWASQGVEHIRYAKAVLIMYDNVAKVAVNNDSAWYSDVPAGGIVVGGTYLFSN